MYNLTIGLPWRGERTLKALVSSKEAFWKKTANQNWGRTPQAIQDLAATMEKAQNDAQINYVAIEHDLDDLLQMLPPAQCFEWEDPSALIGQPQRKGPTVIQPLDIGVAKGHKRTVVERCEAVLQPDL
ncbi:hypothetical protein ANCCAN_18378 [Ancylostoma caninum]|uniref:Uncharacterized protein n=1 Tax=Ancylostoma caninum TaxID=29170 RepID=A0A368FXN7_ANCCA|nr:hypothetical protein ANCCAN_18378 [Ancylostoma caninum]